MTSDQAAQLLAAIADLQEIGKALGLVLGQVAISLHIVCILLLVLIYFSAVKLRRCRKGAEIKAVKEVALSVLSVALEGL